MTEHSCRDLLAELSAYIDGELEPGLCAEIEAHMAGCRDCRTVLTTLSETVDLYRALPPSALPNDAADRLRSSLGISPPESS